MKGILFVFVIGVFSSLGLFAQQNVTVSTGGAGWKRIAMVQSDGGRSFGRVTVFTQGGNYQPVMTSISWYHDWVYNAGMSIYSDSDEPGYWSGFRITDDGANAYIEVNFTASVTALTVMLDDYAWRAATLYTGVLPDGGGVVRAVAKNGRISIESDFSVKHNGFVGIGTDEPTNTLTLRRNALGTSNDVGIDFSATNGSYNPVYARIALGVGTALQGQGTGYLTFSTLNFGTLIESMRISPAGDVGIGTPDPKGYKLAVNGKIRAKEIKVETANWPDYVFAKDYQLPTLQETEKHIKEKGHLPGIPSAEEVNANGINLGEMNAKLLQKIEELTLHLIKQEHTNTQQNKLLMQLSEQNKKQQKEINKLKSKL